MDSQLIGIYKITNILDKKVYIGQSTNIKRRWEEHKKNVYKKDIHRLYEAFRKYGMKNFKFEIIEIINNNEQKIDGDLHYKLDLLEAKYIREYDAENPDKGYNSKPNGFIIATNRELATNIEDYERTEIISDRFKSMINKVKNEIHEGLRKKNEENIIKKQDT